MATGEIDSIVESRRKQRDRITGKLLIKEKKDIEKENEKHRKKLIEIRISEAKGDWQKARNQYKRDRKQLWNLPMVEQERNIMKAGLEWIDKEKSRLFSIISEMHKAKIKHLCQKNNLEIKKPPKTTGGG